MDDRLQSYLDDMILASKATSMKIERDWLNSINAPVKCLPKNVAEAVAARVYLSKIPVEFARSLTQFIESQRLINQAQDR